MFVKEIDDVKVMLEELKSQGLIATWELPYENLLTRRSAAIFFVETIEGNPEEEIWDRMLAFANFKYSINEEKKLSKLKYKITFGDKA